MRFCRHHIVRSWVSLVTGLIFLNLSFIRTEIQISGLREQNQTLYENIAYLLSGSGFEEENDKSTGESGHESDDSHLFYRNYTSFNSDYRLISSGLYNAASSLQLLNGISSIQLPPPKG
jgi:uncharacterized phage infection (PIP) family protein YhgE